MSLRSLVLATLTVSAPAFAIDNPVLRHQSDDGVACLTNLVREQVGPAPELFNFEGPYVARRSNDGKTAQYWIWTNRVRAPGHILKLVTNDTQGWQNNRNGDALTADSLQNTAQVYEFLRGGDTGYYEFSIDLTRCENFLK